MSLLFLGIICYSTFSQITFFVLELEKSRNYDKNKNKIVKYSILIKLLFCFKAGKFRNYDKKKLIL